MVGGMLFSGLGSMWYVMVWLCRYLCDLGVFKHGYSVWPSYIILN